MPLTTTSKGSLIRVSTRPIRLQTKEIQPTDETQTVVPDDGYMGLSAVTVLPGGGGELTELVLPVVVALESPVAGARYAVVGALLQQQKETTAGVTDVIVTADTQNGFFGMSHVTVHPSPVEPLAVTPSLSQQHFTAPEGTVGYNLVTIEAYSGQQRSVTPTFSQQTITPTDGYLFMDSVTVEAVNAQAKTVTAVENTVLTVEADHGYDGLGTVTVNPPGYTDLTWIFEAKSGNHPVVTAEDLNKIKDYIAQDYGGYGLFCYAHNVTSVDMSDVDAVGSYSLTQAMYQCVDLVSVDLSGLESVSGSYAMSNMLYGCTGLTSVSFPNLETVSGSYAMYRTLYNCTGLTSVSFPNLTNVIGLYAMRETFVGTNVEYIDLSSINKVSWGGSYSSSTNFSGGVMYQTFYGSTKLKKVKLPKFLGDDGRSVYNILGQSAWESTFMNCTALTEIDASELTSLMYYNGAQTNYGQRQMFKGCTALQEVNFPNLTTWSWYGFSNGFEGCTALKTVKVPKLTVGQSCNRTCFKGCTALRNVYASPNVFRYNADLNNIFWQATGINNITLSLNANTNLQFQRWTLIADSVKDILQHCNNSNMNGKSVTFKSGLTITDDAEGSIAALKASVVSRGCTVNNLTINPYTP